jgi:hypothetical protein
VKYRIHVWFSIKTGRESFGIQVQWVKGRKYKHASSMIDGVNRGLIYKERSRAEEVIAGLQKGESPNLKTGLVPLVKRRKS